MLMVVTVFSVFHVLRFIILLDDLWQCAPRVGEHIQLGNQKLVPQLQVAPTLVKLSILKKFQGKNLLQIVHLYTYIYIYIYLHSCSCKDVHQCVCVRVSSSPKIWAENAIFGIAGIQP